MSEGDLKVASPSIQDRMCSRVNLEQSYQKFISAQLYINYWIFIISLGCKRAASLNDKIKPTIHLGQEFGVW